MDTRGCELRGMHRWHWLQANGKRRCLSFSSHGVGVWEWSPLKAYHLLLVSQLQQWSGDCGQISHHRMTSNIAYRSKCRSHVRFDHGELAHNIQWDAWRDTSCRHFLLQQHDNARPHTSLQTCVTLVMLVFIVLPYLPYSLNLAPLNYTLSVKMKDVLRGQQIQSSAELHAIAHRWCTNIPTQWFAKALHDLPPNGRSELTWPRTISIRALLINCILFCESICVIHFCMP